MMDEIYTKESSTTTVADSYTRELAILSSLDAVRLKHESIRNILSEMKYSIGSSMTKQSSSQACFIAETIYTHLQQGRKDLAIQLYSDFSTLYEQSHPTIQKELYPIGLELHRLLEMK